MIKIERESTELSENFGNLFECCCFCNTPTPYWAVKKDVACCQSCAEKYEEVEVPTKAVWVAQQNKKGGFHEMC